MKIQYINAPTISNDLARTEKAIREMVEKKGKSVEVSFKYAKQMKTVRQLRYYHKLINLIVEYTGEGKESLILKLKSRLGYYDEYFIDGEVLRDYKSMKDASREKATEFVKNAQVLCVFLGIKYPDPKQFYKSIGANDVE